MVVPIRFPVPSPVRTKMHLGPRDLEAYPVDDAERLAHGLLERVQKPALEGKLARPAILGLGPETIEHYDLLPIARAKADVHRFVSAVAGKPGMLTVGVAGVLGVRMGRAKTSSPGIVVFLEWPDGRWFSILQPLENRRIREDWPPIVRRAEDGYPRPGGMGGWWSRARFEGLSLRAEPPRGQPGQALVH